MYIRILQLQVLKTRSPCRRDHKPRIFRPKLFRARICAVPTSTRLARRPLPVEAPFDAEMRVLESSIVLLCAAPSPSQEDGAAAATLQQFVSWRRTRGGPSSMEAAGRRQRRCGGAGGGRWRRARVMRYCSGIFSLGEGDDTRALCKSQPARVAATQSTPSLRRPGRNLLPRRGAGP